MFDLIMRRARIVDGSGNESTVGDIAVKGEKIVAVGEIHGSAEKVIDAEELVVCPGFIDVHSHADLAVFSPQGLLPKVAQGVTTEIAGNCGFSVAPIDRDSIDLVMDYAGPVLGFKKDIIQWENMYEYLLAVERSQPMNNFVTFVAHGTLRINAMGFEARWPEKIELEHMKKALVQAMNQGAFGLSTGLMYAPGVYADDRELGVLAKVVREYGGIYATHLRSEGDDLVGATAEALDIARRTKVAVHLSHHKAAGRRNWGKTKHTLEMMGSMRKEGYRVTCDRYPYVAGSTTLNLVLPPWVLDGGTRQALKKLARPSIRKRIRQDIDKGIRGWSNIGKSCGWDNLMITSTGSRCKNLYGKSVGELCKLEQKDPIDYICDLLIRENGEVTISDFQFSEEDVRAVFESEFCMVGSDGLHSMGQPHPRLYGTFPRVLSQYVREETLLTLEEAIRKMTYLPAKTFGIKKRGLIREGYYADIVLLDPEKIKDNATYTNPKQLPRGIKYVMVNGKIVMKDNSFTGIRAGKVLRRES